MAPIKKEANPIDRHIGGRIRLRRKMLDLSQEKLAHSLGLTFQQVQKYEKGTNRVGGSRMAKIAQVLKCEVAYFYEGAPKDKDTPSDGKAPPSDYTVDFYASRHGLDIARLSYELNNDKIMGRFVGMLEAILEARR